MSIDAVLFDLDDTLLGNNMDAFLQGYFPLLAAYARQIVEPDTFLPELLAATQAVINSKDRSQTNSDVFWSVFCERNDLIREEVEPFFATFYREEFGRLQSNTTYRPVAAEVVHWCFDRGLKVVIATNPLFPLDAIEQRLSWAGVAVDDFDYDLVTAYENMHSTKPHPAYYREILAAIDVEPERALMVGDNWKNDIVPAAKTGLFTFWITNSDAVATESIDLPDRQGTLEDLSAALQNGWLSS